MLGAHYCRKRTAVPCVGGVYLIIIDIACPFRYFYNDLIIIPLMSSILQIFRKIVSFYRYEEGKPARTKSHFVL